MKCECCNKNRSVQNCYMCIKSICKQCQIINTLNYRNKGVGGDWGTCKECYEQWVYWMKELGKTDFEIFEMLHPGYDKDTVEQLYNGSVTQCDNCKHIWHGNAQCPCWQDIELFDIFDSDDDDDDDAQPKHQHYVEVCESMEDRT